MRTVLLLAALLCGTLAQDLSQIEGLEEGSDEQPSNIRCPRQAPMCEILCAYGFELGPDGCQTCNCKPHPCEVMECPEGQRCDMGPCEGLDCMVAEPTCVPECMMLKCVPCGSGEYLRDERGCQTCDCAPDAVETMPFNCPMPMCATNCEHGYKYDQNGCMTCDCNPAPPPSELNGPCDTMMCLPELECKMQRPLLGCMEDCEPKGICTVPSLCAMMSEMDDDDLATISDVFGEDLASMTSITDQDPSCRDDGSFESRQCASEGDCWCVDDRGVRVPDDLLTYDELENGLCSSRVSTMMKLSFQLQHDLEDGDLDSAIMDIQKLVKQTVGEWLGVQQEVLVSVEVHMYGPGLMTVEIDIIPDDVLDLPSAAHHFNTRTQDTDNECQFEYGDHCMNAVPGSVHTEHLYPDVNPTPTTCFGYYYHHHKKMVIFSCLLVVFVLFLVIGISCMVRYKRTGAYQFQHKKLQNMDTFRKNLVLSSEWDKPDLVSAKDDVTITVNGEVEKKPLA